MKMVEFSMTRSGYSKGVPPMPLRFFILKLAQPSNFDVPPQPAAICLKACRTCHTVAYRTTAYALDRLIFASPSNAPPMRIIAGVAGSGAPTASMVHVPYAALLPPTRPC